MSTISVILLVGAVNLCLGYALAVKLGYGPTFPEETWQPPPSFEPSASSDGEPSTPDESPFEGLLRELVSGADE